MNPKIDTFLAKAQKWQAEMETLRKVILHHPLTEELKWGKPCYMFQDSNILIIQPFKEYCALMFCQGALLKDPEGLLQKPGESTQAARQIRFTNIREIAAKKSILKAYIDEAIAAEKSGLKVIFRQNPEPVPEELHKKWNEKPALKAAFHALTPGRQRAYILYFSAAKQSQTRESRIEKCMPRILDGKGLND